MIDDEWRLYIWRAVTTLVIARAIDSLSPLYHTVSFVSLIFCVYSCSIYFILYTFDPCDMSLPNDDTRTAASTWERWNGIPRFIIS